MKIINIDNQCCARSWGPIVTKKDNKIITSLPIKYKCNDLNTFKLDEFNNLYTLGTRCLSIKKNGLYCKLHDKHLIHENFIDDPTPELCYHFIKDNKIIFY